MSLTALIAIIQALAPLVISAFPVIEQEIQTIIGLIGSKTDLTAAQQQQIDDALDAMHTKLQAQIAADTAAATAAIAPLGAVVNAP